MRLWSGPATDEEQIRRSHQDAGAGERQRSLAAAPARRQTQPGMKGGGLGTADPARSTGWRRAAGARFISSRCCRRASATAPALRARANSSPASGAWPRDRSRWAAVMDRTSSTRAGGEAQPQARSQELRQAGDVEGAFGRQGREGWRTLWNQRAVDVVLDHEDIEFACAPRRWPRAAPGGVRTAVGLCSVGLSTSSLAPAGAPRRPGRRARCPCSSVDRLQMLAETARPGCEGRCR